MLVVGCRGNSNGQDAAAEDAGKVVTGFFDKDAETDDAAKQRQKKKKKTSARPNGLEIPAPLKNKPEQILCRKSYTVSYNSQTLIPNWVAWRLTADHAYGNAQREEEMFTEDTEVPRPRATVDDYFNTGFDRGHMCPAGDNKWSKEAMTSTFVFTNVCPQVRKLNVGPWNDLEIACRRWAKQYGEIYIVCGPILSNGTHRTIGRHKVVVPERFFKVILCNRGTPKAIGFIYENSGHNSERMFSHATNVDEIERLTGIDFFPSLNDRIEKDIEAVRGYF
ncbi:MAG: DNA/RNA non-specific endonuclease [Prevotella sp.]|nr:DNA/RNA non-specific endonuclease [Prevotella sp.]